MTVTATLQKPRVKQKSKKRQAKQNVAPSLLHWRFIVVLAMVIVVFASLATRAAFIQVIQPDTLIKKGDNRTIRVRDIPSYRGLISDRNGQQLAVSVPAQAIYADPKVIHEKGAHNDVRRWEALAEVLNLELTDLLKSIDNPKRRFVYLERQITPAVATFVKQLSIPGVYLRNEAKRYYPAGETTAHVIGFTDIDDKGIEGIERLYHQWLTGTPDLRRIRRDAKNRQVEIIEQTEGKKAKDIQLTIDQRLQAMAYREIKEATLKYQATSASVVIVDVHSGDILALANTPSFNPNNRATVSSHRVRNRAITDAFEPGSVLKPITVLAALENGDYQADSILNTSPGWKRVGGSLVEDSRNLGEISMAEAIKYSSNMATSELALSMPKEVLIDYFYKLGLMEETGSQMIGEVHGIFHERSRWSQHEIATLSFGYNISVTAVQLAKAYAIIANGGMKMPLNIVKSSMNEVYAERVVSEQVANDLVLMMETVTEEGGSGYQARVPGYRVAGKTGTSKKAVAGGYGEEYVNIFAGIAPVSNPQIAVVVLINEPAGDMYYAGDTAAPVFSEIVSNTMQMLNVPPDAMNVDIVLERQVHASR